VSRPHLRVAALSIALACSFLAVTLPALAQAVVTYRSPVDAPVIDPFREPSSPYGPGNRGIEYATVPGAPVRAVAAGAVVFAGSVAGTLYVTVLHADGLRSSYGFLRSVSVRQGERLPARAEVGRSSDHLHLGVRRGDVYLDPESLFAAAPPDVRLVPVGHTPDDEVGAALAARLVAG